MKAWSKPFNLPQFFTYFARESPAWIWKYERLDVVLSSENLCIESLMWKYWLVHGWNNAWDCHDNHCRSYEKTNYKYFYDKVTNVNNQNWLSLYVYFIKDWSHIPSFVSFEKVIEGVDLRNLNRVIILTLLTIGSLTCESLSSKLICFGVDGMSVFQSVKIDLQNKFN
jgi:hypothetical protein